MLGEITPHLHGSAPSSEICDRAKRRHPQLLSSSLYLPLSSAAPPTHLPAAPDGPGLVNVRLPARMKNRYCRR